MNLTFFYRMNPVRKENFIEYLEKTMIGIDICRNQIIRLENRKYDEVIDRRVVERDLMDAYCELDIQMSFLAILIRKLNENNLIRLDGNFRNQVNALIHSLKFVYEEDHILVSSKFDREHIDLEVFLNETKNIMKQIAKH